jgi:Domain of unknown function (DUF4129)
MNGAVVGRAARKGVAGVSQPGRRWPPSSRVVPLALAASGLLALVALGSLRGPLGGGEGRPRFPIELVETLGLLLAVAVVASGVLALLAMLPDQRLRAPRSRRSGVLVLLLPLLAVVAVWLFRDRGWFADPEPPASLPAPAPPSTLELPAVDTRFTWLPVLAVAVVVAALLAIVVAQVTAERRRRGEPRPRPAQLAALLDDTLEDLEREPDPRRAVIAAWARMERGLAAFGLPRRAAEAPFEYAARVLGEARVGPEAVHRLTDLFERAKFSRQTIDQAMRDQAIAALGAVRRELQAEREATTG